MTDASSTTMASANVPQPHTAGADRPSGSRNRGVDRIPGPRSQWLDMPLTQDQQVPHAGETTASTR